MVNHQFEDGTHQGWICIHRAIMDSSVFKNEKWLKVWIWCLLKANHKTTKFPVKTGRGTTVVTLNRGQFIFGRNSASKQLSMPPSTTRNIVYKLATGRFLDIKEDSHYSIVTICNYDKYQNPENYKRTGKRTTKGQPKDTYNNVNNENNKYIRAFHDQFWPIYPKKKDKEKALTAWKKLNPNPSLIEEIILFIKKAEQSEDWIKDKGQYIPYPSTFINGRRWEDNLEYKRSWQDE